MPALRATRPDEDLLVAALFAVATDSWPAAGIDLPGVHLTPQRTQWLRLHRLDEQGRRVEPRHPATGKYLFFSADPGELLAVVRGEFARGLHEASISANPSGEGDYCLLLYDAQPARVDELAHRGYLAAYRRWKSNEDTRAGRYSDQFLSSLPAGHPLQVRAAAERYFAGR